MASPASRSSAARPCSASTTANPSPSRSRRSVRRVASSSSTTRTGPGRGAAPTGVRAARPVPAQDAQQPGAVDGLGEVLHGPQGEAQGLVVGDGEHHHRDVRQGGVGLERRQHRPAVHPRHQHVQGDRVGARRAGQAQALLAPGGGEHPEALPGEGALQQVAHRRVVVDHQHRARPCPPRRALVPAAGAGAEAVAAAAGPAWGATAGRRMVKVEPAPAGSPPSPRRPAGGRSGGSGPGPGPCPRTGAWSTPRPG